MLRYQYSAHRNLRGYTLALRNFVREGPQLPVAPCSSADYKVVETKWFLDNFNFAHRIAPKDLCFNEKSL